MRGLVVQTSAKDQYRCRFEGESSWQTKPYSFAFCFFSKSAKIEKREHTLQNFQEVESFEKLFDAKACGCY